jgi:hypothetical protein
LSAFADLEVVIARRRRALLVVSLLVAGGVAGVSAAMHLCWPLYKCDLNMVRLSLVRHNSIEKIQGWLAEPGASSFDRLNRSAWPPCVRELDPYSLGVLKDNQGAMLTWMGPVTRSSITLTVYLPGRRPPRTPMSVNNYYGLRAPFGEDAYISMGFR